MGIWEHGTYNFTTLSLSLSLSITYRQVRHIKGQKKRQSQVRIIPVNLRHTHFCHVHYGMLLSYLSAEILTSALALLLVHGERQRDTPYRVLLWRILHGNTTHIYIRLSYIESIEDNGSHPNSNACLMRTRIVDAHNHRVCIYHTIQYNR